MNRVPKALSVALTVLLGFSASGLTVAETFGSARVTAITSIYDGDTFRANIAEWPPIVGLRIPVRIKGIDTPELRGKCQAEIQAARAAKQFTVAQLRGAKVIELREVERGKYFRLLADVMVDGQDLGQLLIKGGFAVSYDGGRKRNWCGSEGYKPLEVSTAQ